MGRKWDHFNETFNRIESALNRRMKDLDLARRCGLHSAEITIASEIAEIKREREYVLDARARIYG